MWSFYFKKLYLKQLLFLYTLFLFQYASKNNHRQSRRKICYMDECESTIYDHGEKGGNQVACQSWPFHEFLTSTLDFEEDCSSECRTRPLRCRNKHTCFRKRTDTHRQTQSRESIRTCCVAVDQKSGKSMLCYFVLVAFVFSSWKSSLFLLLTHPSMATLSSKFTIHPRLPPPSKSLDFLSQEETKGWSEIEFVTERRTQWI